MRLFTRFTQVYSGLLFLLCLRSLLCLIALIALLALLTLVLIVLYLIALYFNTLSYFESTNFPKVTSITSTNISFSFKFNL
jgi:hypothetical protein